MQSTYNAIKLWVDDVREPPKGYLWVRSVTEAIRYLTSATTRIEVIDLDHDAGDYAHLGGDYIEILKVMERNKINNIPIHIHSMNPVGVQNMRAIIQHNHWKEI